MVSIQSGTEQGITLGTPIGLMVQNTDHRPHDYSETDLYPRPSHADYTYLEKYDVKASSGGGRSSARETIGEFASRTPLFRTQTHSLQVVSLQVRSQKSTSRRYTASRSLPLSPASAKSMSLARWVETTMRFSLRTT